MVGKRITEPGFSDGPVPGRGFRVTMTVIGAIALLQLVALAIGVIRQGPGSPPAPPAQVVPNTASPPPAEPSEPSIPTDLVAVRVEPVPGPAEPADVRGSVSSAPAVAEAMAPVEGFPRPSVEGSGGHGLPVPTSVDATELFPALAAASRSQPLSDGILERLMVTGAELRESGNTQGALQAFRQVETALPEEPRVLAEIGATLGKMGLKEKADGYWKKVDSLGAIGAGPFYPLAARSLRGMALAADGAGSAVAVPAPSAKTLKIGEIVVEEQAPTSEGQRVGLRVTIDADPSAKPAGEDLSLIVYFYDRVAGGAVRPSTADTSYLYPTEPYDWQVDGREVIVVNYLQPIFTEEQKRELGERSFYGYAVELYYREELQDKVAMPEDIAALRFGGNPVGEGSEDGATTPTFLGPENALFPDSVVPR